MDAITPGHGAPRAQARSGRKLGRGQAVVLFVMSILAVLGFTALVIDVSWYWANTLRVQRAADAAALAGAVLLPDNAPIGVALALKEAKKNGYDVGTTTADVRCPVNADDNRLEICAMQDANPHQMDVWITTPVPTYFAQIFGIKAFPATLSAKAVYQLPVPMGSPENYFGIYCLTKASDVDCSNAADLVDGVNPPGGKLPSKGFWGAVITQGGNQQNGDAYLPANNGGYSPPNNIRYDPAGYSYIVEVPPGGGGTVSIFDPTFCATAGNGRSGHYGTADHWHSRYPPAPVSTYYNLYNLVDPYDASHDGAAIATSGPLFEYENQLDKSTDYGSTDLTSYSDTGTAPQSYPGHPLINCAAGKIAGPGQTPGPGQTAYSGGYWHNKWWTLASGLGPGKYRVQVTTTNVDPGQAGGTIVADQTVNATVAAENMFGIEVTSAGGAPRVYGNGRMAAYNNLVALNGQPQDQRFFLAQIGAENAGKTVELRLFDPGDVGGNAVMRVLQPCAAGCPYSVPNPLGPGTWTYAAATFRYTSDSNWVPNSDAQSGTGRTSITTAVNGRSSFNNTWVTMDIALPSTYGQGGLPDNGWWMVQYTVGDGNDTTTWEVSIKGNPVHLIVP